MPKNENELEGLIAMVKRQSDHIWIKFGLCKCTKITFTQSKLTRTIAAELDIDTKIRKLDQEETYKYLEIGKGNGI